MLGRHNAMRLYVIGLLGLALCAARAESPVDRKKTLLIVAIITVIVAQSLLIIRLMISQRQRKQAEKSLREMTGRLLRAQDEERRRIARDLHDGTGQHLTGIALSVGEVLAEFPQGHDRLRELLQSSHIASRQALNEVRAVSYALHPPILDGIGLLPALQWYVDGLQKRTEFSIDLDVSQAPRRTPPEIERTLFRIVQESVTNALRHSGGTLMNVKLYECAKGITLEVADNGHGIDTQLHGVEDSASIGVGIAGMRERVRQFDGTFTIDFSTNGTRVMVILPNT